MKIHASAFEITEGIRAELRRSLVILGARHGDMKVADTATAIDHDAVSRRFEGLGADRYLVTT